MGGTVKGPSVGPFSLNPWHGSLESLPKLDEHILLCPKLPVDHSTRATLCSPGLCEGFQGPHGIPQVGVAFSTNMLKEFHKAQGSTWKSLCVGSELRPARITPHARRWAGTKLMKVLSNQEGTDTLQVTVYQFTGPIKWVGHLPS